MGISPTEWSTFFGILPLVHFIWGAAEVGLEFICLSVYHGFYVSEAVLNIKWGGAGHRLA